MKKHSLRKTLSLILALLILVAALPLGTAADDSTTIPDSVIFSGSSLLSALTASNVTKELVQGPGRTYVKLTPQSGTSPAINFKGGNLAQYDHYVIKYLQYDTPADLDLNFRSDPAVTGVDYETAFPYNWYQQWSTKGHPAASNGTWKTAVVARDDFQGCATGYAPVPTLENQFLQFKPWNNTTASATSYAAFEYIALFKTESEANAFAASQNSGTFPATSLTIKNNGEEISSFAASIGNTLSFDVCVEPAYAAGAVSLSIAGSAVTNDNGVLKAASAGTATLTFTANNGISDAQTITRTLEVTVSAPDYVVLSASEISATTTGLTATTSVVGNDTLKKQMLRTEVTAASNGGDNVYISYNVSDHAINAKDYPYFRIGYRAKMTNSTCADINVNFDKYHPAGTGDAVSTRLWGPRPNAAQQTFSDFKISYSQYTDGSRSWDTTTDPWTNLGYNWNWMDDAATYTSIWIKPWLTTSVAIPVGDYFEIEYIAFFQNSADMDAFTYSPKLTSLEVTESLEVHIAETKIIEVTTAPAGVYAELTYTSDNTSVATVTDDGKVHGISAGTANITVATADNSMSATCEVTVLDSVSTNYIVVSASELDGKTAKNSSLTGTVTLDTDETAQKRYISTKITSTGGQGDGASVEYSLSSFNIPVKAYPYIQVAYKAKTTNATRSDLNVGLSAYQSDATTVNSVRLWGPTPDIAQQTYSKMNIDYTQYSGGQSIGASYSWDKVTSNSTYTYLRLKPWYFGQAVSGDYFDVEYIAFFTDTASRDDFVYDTTFRSMTVDSTMSLERGTYNKVGVQLTPAGAFVNLKYTSSAPDVASVSSDGTVVAKKAGTAQITVSTLDDSSTGTCAVTVTDASKDYSKYITERDVLSNTLYKLNTDKKLNIVYLGGSVTAGAGASNADATSWRGITGNWFKQMFPDANIKLVNSAMGGSGSMLGAFRTSVDVLAHDPDLVFVEYAVNDSYSGHYADGTVQFYYESIIRQIRESSPDTDIISIFTTDQGKLHDTTMHAVATLQDEVAEHYGISSIDVGLALANHIVAEDAAWSDYVADSVHPKDAGYTIYANVIKQFLFDKLFCAEVLPTSVVEHTLPTTYVDQRNASFYPNYVNVEEGIFDSITNWSFDTSKVWSNIDTAGYISPNGLNNSFSYTFNGTGIAFFMEFNVGTNAEGKSTNYLVEYSIDDEESQVLRITDTNHPFNKMFKTGALEDGEHTITFSYLGMDINGDRIVDDGETGVRPGLKISRLLVSQTAEPTDDPLPGDVNGDGKVDATDAVMLSRYIAGWASYGANDIVLANANVDATEGITPNDNVVLSRHIASWNGYSTLPFTN